jgi:hypothetical protein
MKISTSYSEVTEESHPELWQAPTPPLTARELIAIAGKGKRKFVIHMPDVVTGKTYPVKVDLSKYSEAELDSVRIAVQIRFDGESKAENEAYSKEALKSHH